MVRRLPWRAVAALALLGLVLLLSACSSSAPQSTITDESVNNNRIWDVYTILWIAAAIVFVLVEGLLVYTIIKFRSRPKTAHGRPVPVHGNTRLEIIWTIIPAIVLVVIAVPTLQVLAELEERPDPSEDPLKVSVIAHQFYFEFQYEAEGIGTTNELHIPANRKVDLALMSDDVIHALWAPRLGGKVDSIPGRINHMWLEAHEPGEYAGQCAEFCGVGHGNMRFKVIVHEEADFLAWVEEQKNPQPGGDVAAGEAFFLNGPCAGCHMIDGTSAGGTLGPNLTHFASQPQIAGVLENTEENLKTWLANPPAVKPGTGMPNLNLSQKQIDDLTAFLMTLE